MGKKSRTKRVRKNIKKKRKKIKLTPKDFLSSGSTMLNLAATGHPERCYAKGGFFPVIGDSGAGKTFLTLGAFAEATINPNFDEYALVFDNIEDGALMDMSHFFGNAMMKRLQPPRTDSSGDARFSENIEDFYANCMDWMRRGPCIYLVDSMDALGSVDEDKKFDKTLEAFRAGKDLTELKGSYGDGKAKKNSAGLRKVVKMARKTGSIILMVIQTRDAIGSLFADKTYAGGRAIKFYASLEMWLSSTGKLEKTFRSKKRELGLVSRVRIKKNRYTGRLRECRIPIYHSFGFDDVGSTVDYLISEGHWKKSGTKFKAEEVGLTGTKEQIIKAIEEDCLERDIRQICGMVHDEIERAVSVDRKKRY